MNVEAIFEAFSQVNALIVGDVMIDRYVYGKVERISPEAPVPVVDIQGTENRLGGAANVALNLKALGATPYLCSLIGQDDDGDIFTKIIQQKDLPEIGILPSPTWGQARPQYRWNTTIIKKNTQLTRY